MKHAVAVAALIVTCIVSSSPALAEMTWCAVVKTDIPGGSLNIRSGPSADSAVRYELRPGDIMALSTGHEEGDWRLVENAYTARDGGKNFDIVNASGDREYAGTFGWARETYMSQVECPDGWGEDSPDDAPTDMGLRELDARY